MFKSSFRLTAAPSLNKASAGRDRKGSPSNPSVIAVGRAVVLPTPTVGAGETTAKIVPLNKVFPAVPSNSDLRQKGAAAPYRPSSPSFKQAQGIVSHAKSESNAPEKPMAVQNRASNLSLSQARNDMSTGLRASPLPSIGDRKETQPITSEQLDKKLTDLKVPGDWPGALSAQEEKTAVQIKTQEPDLEKPEGVSSQSEVLKSSAVDKELANDKQAAGFAGIWQRFSNLFKLPDFDVLGMGKDFNLDLSGVTVDEESMNHSGATKFLHLYTEDEMINKFLYNDNILKTLEGLGYNQDDFLITVDLSDSFVHHIVVSHRKLLNAGLQLSKWVDPLRAQPHARRMVASQAMQGETSFSGDAAISCDGKFYPINKDNFLVDVIAKRSTENLNLHSFKSFIHLNTKPDSDISATQTRALQYMKQAFPKNGVDVTVIEWLAMQNPLAEWDLTRPPLPGQHHPSLSIASTIGKIMAELAYNNKRDGLMNQPEEFHLAYKYNQAGYRFINPHYQGWFKALADAMEGNIERHGLSAVSWCVHNEAVECDKRNAPQDLFGIDKPEDRKWFVEWKLEDQILPLSDKMKAYFETKEYEDIAEQAYKEHVTKFWIDWELNRDVIRIREFSQEYLRGAGLLPVGAGASSK